MRGQRRQAKDDAKKAETGNRTPDLPLTKRLLYQLSYLGINNGKLIRYKYFTKNKELLHVYFFTARVGADKTLIFFTFPGVCGQRKTLIFSFSPVLAGRTPLEYAAPTAPRAGPRPF